MGGGPDANHPPNYQSKPGGVFWGGGGGGNESGLSEGVGRTLGRGTRFNTATHPELLDSHHSKAHDVKEEWGESQCKRNAPTWGTWE